MLEIRVSLSLYSILPWKNHVSPGGSSGESAYIHRLDLGHKVGNAIVKSREVRGRDTAVGRRREEGVPGAGDARAF